MRFVDITELEFPVGWQARADSALAELRAEIDAAVAVTAASGGDVAAARRKAISDGLAKAARMKVWQDLGPHLAALMKRKCWYSESLNPTADKNVDHFRPKNRVAEDAAHEGYWWLAFDWRNFRYSSQWCNQRRVDKKNGSSGGKLDHFPLAPSSTRAFAEGDDLDCEDPALLDPIDPDDWKLLTFRPDGHPTPSKPAGSADHERAESSIRIYHLHCKELVDDRRIVFGRIQRLVQGLERLRPKIDDPKIRAVYKSHQVELLKAVRPDSEYSAAALAYTRAEIYTLSKGHQVRRDWLAEMLY